MAGAEPTSPLRLVAAAFVGAVGGNAVGAADGPLGGVADAVDGQLLSTARFAVFSWSNADETIISSDLT
jgi:hypothetical protein